MLKNRGNIKGPKFFWAEFWDRNRDPRKCGKQSEISPKQISGHPFGPPWGGTEIYFPKFGPQQISVQKFGPEISVPKFGFFTARIRRHFGPGFGPAISGPCAGPLSKFRPTQSGPQSRNHVKSQRIVPYHGLPYFT